jgi:hypothetical protein
MPVQHIALFQFKNGTSEAIVQRATDDLRRLAKIIPGITNFSIGTNSSPEGLADGLTHGFVMTFKDAAARDAYLPHPEHEKFKTFVLPHIEQVVVFDYEC